jgi:hypothetical protein
LTVNKNSRGCFTDIEWTEFVQCLQEFLDVEHNVECLKITLGQWCDVSELVSQHNSKCWQRGYIRKNIERRVPAWVSDTKAQYQVSGSTLFLHSDGQPWKGRASGKIAGKFRESCGRLRCGISGTRFLAVRTLQHRGRYPNDKLRI